MKNFVDFDLEPLLRIDEDAMSALPTVAREIRNRIEKGALLDDIVQYKRETLRKTLSYFRVANRSKLATKEEMAGCLINAFRYGKNEYGDKSRKVIKKKQKDEKEDRFVTIQNGVINTIKRRGGL